MIVHKLFLSSQKAISSSSDDSSLSWARSLWGSCEVIAAHMAAKPDAARAIVAISSTYLEAAVAAAAAESLAWRWWSKCYIYGAVRYPVGNCHGTVTERSWKGGGAER